MTTVDFSPEASAGEGRNGFPTPLHIASLSGPPQR